MRNSEVLNVWYENILVGQIWREETGRMGFQYEENWLKNGFPISQQLPLANKQYSPENAKAHKFFANLLPEEGARLEIVRNLKITNTDFELLKAIGGECAGALSILPSEFNHTANHEYKKLSKEELKKIISRKANFIGNLFQENRPRLSLAGAQDKCPILFKNNEYYLPQGAAASTHIIKFELADYKNIPIYEYFLSKLAITVGLPVVECELKTCDRESYLLIKRYDRITTSQRIKRLHQEDFCQALGISYEKKYQLDGGPTFFHCYEMLQKTSVQPIKDTESLLKWHIFNFLTGNSDGHAKNLALVYSEKNNISLAPFYDLVCTRAIDKLDERLAFSTGGEFNPGNINMKHWTLFAQECDIREQYLRKMLHNMAKILIEQVKEVKQNFENDHGPFPALQRIEIIVTKQCRKLLKQLN